MQNPNLNKIKKIVEDFLEKITFKADVDVRKTAEDNVSVSLKMEDPQILIGQGGETLKAIQHLLKMIIYKELGEIGAVDIDINEYKKKKIEYLRELARSVADEVSLMRREKILDPMPAYDRRIIHAELAERADVATESIGEEPDRRIVIKPRI